MRRIYRIGLIFFFCLLFGQQASFSETEALAAPYIPMANPPQASPLLIGEGRDYAAIAVSDLWEMSNIQDIYNEKTHNLNSDYPFLNTNRMNLDAANGLLYGLTKNNDSFPQTDPYIFLVWPGYPEYQNIYKHYGEANPINADTFRYLMFRLYLSGSQSGDAGRVVWSNSLSFNTANLGISKPFSFKEGWNTYLIDLKTIGVEPSGPLPWAGNMLMLRLNLPNRENVEVKLDWVRLWADDGNNIPKTTISWEDAAGVLSLYAVPAFGQQETSMPIAQGIRASTLSRTWQAGIFPPGQYYIYSIQTKDYAVAAYNEPWDMRSTDHVVQDPNGSNDFIESVAALGQELRFTTVAGPNDPSIYFHIDTIDTKIDTSLYKYFSFRLKFENPESVDSWMRMADLYWFPSGGGVFDSGLMQLQGDTAYHVYTIDLSANANWAATGDITLFRLDPIASSKSGQKTRIVLDWATLSSEPLLEEVDLNPIIGWSDQPLTVQAAPQVEFLNPAYDSGGDYATEVLQDAWDMSQATDVAAAYHLLSIDFSEGYANFLTDGVVVDLTPSGDSQLALRTGQFFHDTRTPIDPLRYRYVNHRFIELDPQDTQLGSIHRYIVWDDLPEQNTTFNAEVTNENWNHYSLDLATADIVAGQGSAMPWQQHPYIKHFIFHPNEIPFYSVRGGYDDVLLTSMAWGDQNFLIRWEVKTGSPASTVKLYRDTDRNPGGEVLIGQTTLGAGQYDWNCSAVPNGQYYIVMKISDGLSLERVKYSLVPMVVKRQVKITLDDLPAVMQGGFDYASDDLNPWDFSNDSDLDKSLLPSGYTGLNGVTFQNGFLSATTANDDPYFFLSSPDLIDAARYRWLTFRLRSDYYDNDDATTDFVVTWSVNNNWYQTSPVKLYPGWGIYAIDLQEYPNWSGMVDHLRIDPASVSERSFALDWVRLTEPKVKTLTWSLANTTASTRISLYAVPAESACDAVTAPSRCTEGALLIARNLGVVSSYNWDYGGLEAGSYRIIAVADDRISPLYEDSATFAISTTGEPAPRLPEGITVTAGANQSNFPVWFKVYNDGGGTYTWSAVSLNNGLLTVQPPTSGTTVSSSTIKFTVNSFGRAPGNYATAIRITVTINSVPQQFDIPVTIRIVPLMNLTALPLTTR